MLGMLFGMIVILGALAGAIWYAVAVLTPDQVTNNQASDYVGDYGKMSLKSIYDDVMKKFESYRGKYYDTTATKTATSSTMPTANRNLWKFPWKTADNT